MIYSNEDYLYLGCGLGSWGDKIPDHCSPFKQWRDVYDFDPIDSYLDFPNAEAGRIGQIIGQFRKEGGFTFCLYIAEFKI